MKGTPPYRFMLYGVFLLLAVIYASKTFLGNHTLEIGGMVPPVQLPIANGEVLDLSRAPGRVVVLSFWASWCKYCRNEVPILNALSEQVLVVGICLDNADVAAAQQLGRGLGMTFPIVGDRPDLARTFAVGTLPTIYVVAPNGSITFARAGVTSQSSLMQAVKEASARQI